MFGLTEKELDRYKDLVQTYAIRDLATDVIEDSTLLVDLIVKDGKYYPVPSSSRWLQTSKSYLQ